MKYKKKFSSEAPAQSITENENRKDGLYDMNSDTEEDSGNARLHAVRKNAAGASTSTDGANFSDPVGNASTVSISANGANKSTNLINFSPDKSGSDGKSDAGEKLPIPSTLAGRASESASGLNVNFVVPFTYAGTDMVSQIARGCDQFSISDNGSDGSQIQENIDLNILEKENEFGAANDSFGTNDSDIAIVAEYFYATEEESAQANKIKDEN